MADDSTYDQGIAQSLATPQHNPSAYGGGFFGGLMSIVGPKLDAHNADDLAQRQMERAHFYKLMTDPALAADPADSPEVAATKQRQLQWATDEYAKRSGKQAKGLVQKLLPMLQRMHGHPADGQPAGPPVGKPPASAANAAPAPPALDDTGAPDVNASAPATAAAAAPSAGSPPAPARVAAPPPPTLSDLSATVHRGAVARSIADTQQQHEAEYQFSLKHSPTKLAYDQISAAFPDMPEAEKRRGALIKSGMIPAAMAHASVTGIVSAKQARAQGIDVPDDIPDEQNVNVRHSMFGDVVTPTNATPAGMVSTPTGDVSRTQSQIDKESRELSQWKLKEGIKFNHALTLQSASLQNALAKSDYDGAQKIVRDARANYDEALDRQTTMDQNMTAAFGGDQQAMLSLVANHIGMTLGAQKGARITRAVWDEATSSAPWMQKVGAKFDDRGYLSGVTLTVPQMQQMVDLAHEKVGILGEHADRSQKIYAGDLTARKRSAAAPPPPSAAVGSPLTIDEARSYLKAASGDKAKARAAAKADGRSF